MNPSTEYTLFGQAVAREGIAAFWPRAAFVLVFCGTLAAVARYYSARGWCPN